MSGHERLETDILVIGAGPTGGATALALARLGVGVHVVSRWNWLADSPRAHITNQRTMEVLRDLGVEEECRLHGTPWEMMGDTMFTTSLAGEELVRMRTWGTGDERRSDYLSGSPCPYIDLIQPEIEPILVRNAAARGASFAFNTDYLSHVEDADGVTATLQDRQTGRRYEVRAKYLVGADGARSRVLGNAGLDIVGDMDRAGTVYVNFRADLTRFVAHRPSILHWIVSPDASFGEIGLGLLRAVRPWTEWIAGWGFDISKGDPDLSPAHILRQLRVLIGDPGIEVEVIRSSVWYVNQAYAPVYSAGRVFCAGDAVHRHPPSSGLGLNTCVQDAHNLAWKLAYVVKGHAGPALLQSFSDERAPVGRQIVLRANQSRLDYAPLRAAFRVPGAENPILAGIARFRDPGPDGVAARKAVEAALTLKNTEFNAQGVEMNQRYRSAAILPEPGAGEEVWQRDPTLYLQPSTRPGARLPHAWLIGADGRRKSTLDLVGQGAMTLVTGLAGTAWAAAVAALDLPYLKVAVIGAPGARDVYCDWQRLRGIDEGGALLVRPDGFIAWRQSAAPEDDAAARSALGAALEAVLGRAVPAED